MVQIKIVNEEKLGSMLWLMLLPLIELLTKCLLCPQISRMSREIQIILVVTVVRVCSSDLVIPVLPQKNKSHHGGGIYTTQMDAFVQYHWDPIQQVLNQP